jgi:hypothetical protein
MRQKSHFWRLPIFTASLFLTSCGLTSGAHFDEKEGIVTWRGKLSWDKVKPLIERVNAMPTVKELLIINSRGGDGASMYAVQKLVHDRKIRVSVSGYCLSACAQIYITAESHRLLAAPFAFDTYLQFHGSYDAKTNKFVNFFKPEEIDIVRRATHGLMPTELYIKARMSPNPHGGLYIYKDLFKDTKHSVFFCDGKESNIPGECERLEGNAVTLGLNS